MHWDGSPLDLGLILEDKPTEMLFALHNMQIEKSELQSELSDQREQNTGLEEKSRDLQEENRELKELVDQMDKEINVRTWDLSIHSVVPSSSVTLTERQSRIIHVYNA